MDNELGWQARSVKDFSISLPASSAHIFPKAQVASNKNAHNFIHHIQALFFMLFHMMRSILFGMLALKTMKWKYVIGSWEILTNRKVVSQANTPNKMDHAKWKSIKKSARKWCWKLCAFLFEVTCDFGKLWVTNLELLEDLEPPLDPPPPRLGDLFGRL